MIKFLDYFVFTLTSYYQVLEVRPLRPLLDCKSFRPYLSHSILVNSCIRRLFAMYHNLFALMSLLKHSSCSWLSYFSVCQANFASGSRADGTDLWMTSDSVNHIPHIPRADHPSTGPSIRSRFNFGVISSGIPSNHFEQMNSKWTHRSPWVGLSKRSSWKTVSEATLL